MRKFADRQTKNTQVNVSITESTHFLSGSSLDTRGSWPITESTLSSLDPFRIHEGVGQQVAEPALEARSGVRKNITYRKQTEKLKLKMATIASK